MGLVDSAKRDPKWQQCSTGTEATCEPFATGNSHEDQKRELHISYQEPQKRNCLYTKVKEEQCGGCLGQREAHRPRLLMKSGMCKNAGDSAAYSRQSRPGQRLCCVTTRCFPSENQAPFLSPQWCSNISNVGIQPTTPRPWITRYSSVRQTIR